MAKSSNEKQRLEHNDTGGHLGGTKFGQTPGTAGANPAKPDGKSRKKEQQRSDTDRDGSS